MVARVVSLIFALLMLPMLGRAGLAQSVAPTAEVGRTDPDDAQQLAGKELKIGRYEMSKKNFIGGINRFKTVITAYQRSSAVPEALAGLVECYLTLGIHSEAQTAAGILARKYKDSPWTASSLALLKSAGLEPRDEEKSWIHEAFRNNP
jgi:lipopolysaccharide biosynthesis regulator YciM